MSQPLDAVMVGAGDRGYHAYGPYALQHPDRLRFTAVAEPHEERRLRFAEAHSIEPARQFRGADELLDRGRLGQALFLCNLDHQHEQPALAALGLGYHLMLEKPMANTLDGCLRIARAARQAGVVLSVGHVLRYTEFFSEVHRLVSSGRLGRVITVAHRENLAYTHMAHSFVRGNWRSSGVEAPMILAKCCHDLDLLHWNMGPVTRLSSFGSLEHFTVKNAPAGAPARCTDGCPAAAACPYDAARFYLGEYTGWPVSVISADTSLQARRQALEQGPYGRCVYRCDNDVVDHQVVSLSFASGASGVLVMHGHSHLEGRTMRYDGTRATLRGRFTPEHGNVIEVHDHGSGPVERLEPTGGASGHGGGDKRLTAAFVDAVRGDASVRTGPAESLESHLLAFAAEQARVQGEVVQVEPFRQRG